MPATYYTLAVGPVQFFVLDTIEIPAAQLQLIDKELGTSKARWKLVYGASPNLLGRYTGRQPTTSQTAASSFSRIEPMST